MHNRKRYFLIILLLCVCGVLSVYLQMRGNGQRNGIHLPVNLPMAEAGWQGSPFAATMPRDVESGDFILRSYRQERGGQLNLLALHSRISNYHPPSLCYQGSGRRLSEIPAMESTSGRIRLAGLMAKGDYDTTFVYHGFYIGGKIIPDGIEKKGYEVTERFIQGHIKQYFLEIAIGGVQSDLRQDQAYVRRFLDDMEKYLITPE